MLYNARPIVWCRILVLWYPSIMLQLSAYCTLIGLSPILHRQNGSKWVIVKQGNINIYDVLRSMFNILIRLHSTRIIYS